MLCSFHLKFLKSKRMDILFCLFQLDEGLLKSNGSKGAQCSAWGIRVCDRRNLHK